MRTFVLLFIVFFASQSLAEKYQQLPAKQARSSSGLSKTVDDEEVICPGGEEKCPSHTTCCPLEGAQQAHSNSSWSASETEPHSPNKINKVSYGCCPLEGAVCCDDHVHCCPGGTTCDTKQGICIGEFQSSKAYQKPFQKKLSKEVSEKVERAMLMRTPHPSVTVCNGGTNVQQESCPKGSKCCFKVSAMTNGYGRRTKKSTCCPFIDGQCCTQSNHCCPKGFKCSSSKAKCISKQNGAVLSTSLVATTFSEKMMLLSNFYY